MSVESNVVTVRAALLLLLWLGSSISSGLYARRQLVKLVRASRHVLNEEFEVFMSLNLRATHMVPIVHRVWYLWQRRSRLSKVRGSHQGPELVSWSRITIGIYVQTRLNWACPHLFTDSWMRARFNTDGRSFQSHWKGQTVQFIPHFYLPLLFFCDLCSRVTCCLFLIHLSPASYLCYSEHIAPLGVLPRGSCPAPVLHPSAAPTPSICCHGD